MTTLTTEEAEPSTSATVVEVEDNKRSNERDEDLIVAVSDKLLAKPVFIIMIFILLICVVLCLQVATEKR